MATRISVAARVTVSVLNSRPKAVGCRRRLSRARVSRRITKAVVVLTPPAVEAGLPPMNMSPISSISVGPLSALTDTVLNPAVRAVTDWNRLGRSASCHGRPSNSACRSKR